MGGGGAAGYYGQGSIPMTSYGLGPMVSYGMPPVNGMRPPGEYYYALWFSFPSYL